MSNDSLNKPDALSPLSESLKAIDLTGHPPVDQWQPAHVGEIDIVIKADGSWWHEGTVFKRERLVNLFASVLWQEEGEHYLKTPAEKMRIQVEEAAFYIPLLDIVDAGTPAQQLVFTSSYGDIVVAGPAHHLWVEEDVDTAEPAPYISMRYGMKGKLSRNVFYQLAEVMEQKPCAQKGEAGVAECLFVKSRGVDFLLGKANG